MGEEAKSYQALTNGLIRQDYFGDTDVTDEFLKTELFSNITQDEFDKMIGKSRSLIKTMATSHMDLNQTEAFLTSQVKKRDHPITESQAKVLLKSWKTHRQRVHDTLVQKTSWNKRLKNLKWRIDAHGQSRRHANGDNSPTAIMELQLENPQDKTAEVVQFEMDETNMSKVLRSLDEISQQIETLSKT